MEEETPSLETTNLQLSVQSPAQGRQATCSDRHWDFVQTPHWCKKSRLARDWRPGGSSPSPGAGGQRGARGAALWHLKGLRGLGQAALCSWSAMLPPSHAYVSDGRAGMVPMRAGPSPTCPRVSKSALLCVGRDGRGERGSGGGRTGWSHLQH